MASTTKARPMGDVPGAFMGLLAAQMKFGQQLFESFTGMKAPDMTSSVSQSWAAWQDAWQSPPASRPACTVPPPCWMPKMLGDISSYACGCSTVTVKIEVTNCDRVARTFSIRSDGVEGVKVAPESVNLNPMRRGTIEVSFKLPDEIDEGTEYETLLWIEGCNQHVLRWTIVAGKSGMDSTHEVKVSDCPDYRHHWYDHFYCNRPCSHARVPRNG